MPLPAFSLRPLDELSRPNDQVVLVVGVEPAAGSSGSTGSPEALVPRPLRGCSGALTASGALPSGELAQRLTAEKATGRSGELTTLRLAGPQSADVLALGLGDRTPTEVRRAAAALARRLNGRDSVRVLLGSALGPAAVRAFVEGYGLAAYVPPRSGRAAASATPAAPVVDLFVTDPARAAEAFGRAVSTARAVHLARDLAHTPANVKSPRWLADQAVAMAGRAGLGVRVRDEHELLAQGFGGLIGVGQGSDRPPRFVELTYLPPGTSSRAARSLEHVVLIGKGITFDSGGISIKPAAGMELMKTDMGGAAAIVGVMSALAEHAVPVRVTGLLAVAENLPGANALRPGDVIRPFGGARTVEILNTDAEGRLVLADALGYADRVLDADVVVDLATLTGAATLALGRRDAPLYATDDRLAAALERAAAASGERVWRMPLVDDYRRALDSETADLANAVMGSSVGGGSITAALFLREFTGGRPWAHLDIAGTGRSDRDVDELGKGGTGYGVRLLLRWLEDR